MTSARICYAVSHVRFTGEGRGGKERVPRRGGLEEGNGGGG